MKSFFFLFLLFYSFPLPAIDWPSSPGNMVRNFGVNIFGLPHLGLTFNTSETIQAAEGGDLLYFHDQKNKASRLPSALGSWIAVDHGDGIISIYSRFGDQLPKEELIRTSNTGRIQRGMHLGEAGISGWASRNGFFFQLYDRTEKRWINPLLIINSPTDIRPPDILSVRLINSDGLVFFNPSPARNLSQGRYTVIVDTFDTMVRSNETPLAPHRITCFLNGREAGELNFESYSTRDGSLTVQRNGIVQVRQVYANFPAFEIADIWLSRGQATLEIIVQDVSENTRSMIYRFVVE